MREIPDDTILKMMHTIGAVSTLPELHDIAESTKNKYTYTMLRGAISGGQLESVQYLCPKLSTTNKRVYLDMLAGLAARKNQLEILQYIVESESKIDILSNHELVEDIIADGDEELIKYIFSGIFKIPENISLGNLLASEGHLELLKYFVQKEIVSVESSNFSAYRSAAIYGQLEILKFIDDVTGGVPVMDTHHAMIVSLTNGRVDIVRYLAEETTFSERPFTEGSVSSFPANASSELVEYTVSNVFCQEDALHYCVYTQQDISVLKTAFREDEEVAYGTLTSLCQSAAVKSNLGTLKYFVEESTLPIDQSILSMVLDFSSLPQDGIAKAYLEKSIKMFQRLNNSPVLSTYMKDPELSHEKKVKLRHSCMYGSIGALYTAGMKETLTHAIVDALLAETTPSATRRL